MPETIYKLQPDRTCHLRGTSDFGAAGMVHSATPTGCVVSGVFRKPSDFTVFVVYDIHNFYEHPRLKYLPDPGLTGMVWTFDVHYRNLQPLDSPKFPTIDWPYLDVIRTDESRAQIALFDHAQLVGGTYAAAAGSFTVQASAPAGGDTLVIWYLNIGFQFTAAGGETAAHVADALAAAVNGQDWTTLGPVAALWAESVNGSVNLTFARYGQVTTSGRIVTLTAGQTFVGLSPGDAVLIGGKQTTVTSFIGAHLIQVADDLGSQLGVAYLAARGGYDGNMVNLYSVGTGGLATAQSTVKLSGGSSDATWRVTLDFTALGIDQVRQMWLTFAPRLADGAEYAAEEWDATFSNWGVADPLGKRPLQVASANSVRTEESDYGCVYSGLGWSVEAGFFSQGFARVADMAGDSVTVRYGCQVQHDVWIGTSLYSDRGQFAVSMDGDAETTLDMRLAVEPAIVTRKLLRSGVAAGEHKVKLRWLGAGPVYFDFLEAVVSGDVPDVAEGQAQTTVALDLDTDHTAKLSPQRILWSFENLGFNGPMNLYMGVFGWNQREISGDFTPSATVKFEGVFVAGDQVFVNIGGQAVGKTVFPNETNTTIAQHLAFFINETYSGVWAAGSAGVLTITSRSSVGGAYNFTLDVSTELAGGSTGKATVTGSLSGGVPGIWVIDPDPDPPINYGVRRWLADFFREVKARGRTVVCSFSMELTNAPDDPASGAVWTSRYPDGKAVLTATTFATLTSAQGAVGALAFLDYQKRVFLNMAQLQDAAGLVPEEQLGEHVWWYFTNKTVSNPNGGMAYYDAETAAAAAIALGRALHVFTGPNDDPTVNGGADVAFLAARLRDHDAAIMAFVRAAFPAAIFELLWPYDVNYPKPIGRAALGGQLNFAVSLPAEWKSKTLSGLNRFAAEALDFGSATRSLDLALQAIRLPGFIGWPLDSVRYFVPIFNGGCPWEAEYLMAQDERIAAVVLFAFDHFSLFALRVGEPVARPGASWF